MEDNGAPKPTPAELDVFDLLDLPAFLALLFVACGGAKPRRGAEDDPVKGLCGGHATELTPVDPRALMPLVTPLAKT